MRPWNLSLPFVLLAATTVTASASAHTVLVNPPPLIGNDDAKTGPCGCTFGGGGIECPTDYTVTELEAGAQVTVSWNETVNHPGEFRIAYAPVAPEAATVADFDDAVDQVTVADDMAGGLFSQTFTVPNTPCDLCTIQVRQFMSDSGDNYFTCAAVRIVGSGEGGATPSTTTTTVTSGSGPTTAVTTGSGNPSDDDGGGGEAQWQPEPEEGGCSATGEGGGASFGAALLLALAGAFAATRGRRRS